MKQSRKTRIEITDTIQSSILKMGGGNPGALRVLVDLSLKGGEIDPDDFMGGFGSILFLDTLGIYEENIWGLYKDICGESLLNTVGLLRAVQLGFFDGRALLNIVSGPRHEVRAKLPEEKVAELLKKVQTRLPNFAKTELEGI